MSSFLNLIFNKNFSFQDPYVNLTIGGQTQKTGVANNAGKTPTWNDEFRFTISGESLMNF